MNPNKACNFNCVYCEVSRLHGSPDQQVNIKVMSAELKRMLRWVQEKKIQELPCYRTVPEELLQFREVALSGNGEPTLCPNFAEVVQELVHIRASPKFPFQDCSDHKRLWATLARGATRFALVHRPRRGLGQA
jgi:wyosine [tRNA(Phe)-imidazoG37] synthetase (radical SAM superfamily)